MWLLGLVGAAAGLVAAIYLYDVLSGTLGSGSQSESDVAAKRLEELKRRWTDTANKDDDETESSVKED